MANIVPRTDLTDTPPDTKDNNAFRWVLTGFVVFITVISLSLWALTVHHTRKIAERQSQTASDTIHQGSPLISFGTDDVKVSHRWSPLAGTHPTVTFTCRIAPSPFTFRFVKVFYRPLGSSEWIAAETRPRKNVCRITLHDLHRNMSYECFFAAYGKDTTIASNCLAFNTIQTNNLKQNH